MGLYTCLGDAIQNYPGRAGSQDQGVANCALTGGASGGGWIYKGVAELGVELPLRRASRMSVWGPYFGDVVKQVFESAE